MYKSTPIVTILFHTEIEKKIISAHETLELCTLQRFTTHTNF